MSYLDTVNDKRSQAKQQQELSANLRELKKIQMATMMGQSKPSVVLTDQTDLGDKIKELTSKLTSAVTSTDTTGLSKQQLQELKALQTGLDKLTRAVQNNQPDNSDIVRAIKALKLDNVINLPEPKVTVHEKDIDFTPLQDTIKEYFPHPDAQIDLSSFRAQDIDNSSDDTQYVGFVNPKGEWYIIENKVNDNSMRYVFGRGNYGKAFTKASSYKYELLNEAIDALTA